MKQYVTFQFGGEWGAIDVGRVQEVLLAQPLRRVPLAGADVAGLLNLRGEVVPVIDLARRLGIGRAAPGASHLVVWGPEGTVSLLVDGLADVESVAGAAPVPATVAASLRGALEGVAEIGGRFFLLLAADRVATFLESSPVLTDETSKEQYTR